jgi:transcriptional regulator with XRE-family HTH domain
MITANLGPVFRAARRGTGLSATALARRSEISRTTISRWERGERNISIVTYEHLSYALADFMAGRWAA